MSAHKPIYLIASSEPLLRQEARDTLCKAIHQAGYRDRQTFYVDSGFCWDVFFTEAKNYNLFSEKTLIELHHPSAKFTEKSLRVLLDYSANPPQDKILLILCDKLSSAQQKTRWYKAIEKIGKCINISGINRHELPGWIQQRVARYSLSLDRESISLLAELTEGNLSSCSQAIEKLNLLYSTETQIHTKHIISVVTDCAQFNVFDLANLTLGGKARDALRCLQVLKNTNLEATLVLWALTRDIRELLGLKQQIKQGAPLLQLLQKQWQSRRELLKSALQRLSEEVLDDALQFAEFVDQTIKGMTPQKPWEALERLVLGLCHGRRLHQYSL